MLGATLKEVRDFYLQQLQNPQLQQPVGTPSTMVTNRQCRRTSRSRGNAAVVSSERFVNYLFWSFHDVISFVLEEQ